MFVRETFTTNLFFELISSIFFTLMTSNVNVESSLAIVNVNVNAKLNQNLISSFNYIMYI